MSVQRPVRSPRYHDDFPFVIYPKVSPSSLMKQQQQQQQQPELQQQQQQHFHSEADINSNINEIRQLIREQSNAVLPATTATKTSFVGCGGGKRTLVRRQRNSNSDSSDELDVPVRRFTPLPDIPRIDDAYFRTESRLIKDIIHDDNESLFDDTCRSSEHQQHHMTAEFSDGNAVGSTSTATLPDCSGGHQQFESNSTNVLINDVRGGLAYNQVRAQLGGKVKETRYHFGPNAHAKITHNYRLPALTDNSRQQQQQQQQLHSLHNTMDLDEDLPLNPVQSAGNAMQATQRLVYTSPGDRIISPIKRPQAPSPAASAYRRKTTVPGLSGSESDDGLVV